MASQTSKDLQRTYPLTNAKKTYHTNSYVSSNENIENLPDGNLIGGSTGDEKKDDIIMQKEAKHGKYNHAILPTFGDVFEPTLKRPICRKFKKDWSGEVIAVVSSTSSIIRLTIKFTKTFRSVLCKVIFLFEIYLFEFPNRIPPDKQIIF